MGLEKLLSTALGVLDISSTLNVRVIGSLFLISLLAEFNLQVPLLMESTWLLVGYQSRVNNLAALNTGLLILAAQGGRQVGILTLYYFVGVINKPFSRLLLKLIKSIPFYRKHIQQNLFDTRFLSLLPATIGMLTTLNWGIKLLLSWRRRLGVLLIGTLASGLIFDLIYLLAGAIFRIKNLNIAYIPVFFLAVYLVLMYIRRKALR